MGRSKTERSETRRENTQGGGNNGGDQRQQHSIKKKCFNCGKTGHMKADCHSRPSAGGSRNNGAPGNRCQRCNRAGHAAGECRTRPENLPSPRTHNTNSAGPRAQPPRKCHTCGKPGHLARDCRSGGRPANNGQRSNGPRTNGQRGSGTNNNGPRTEGRGNDQKKCYNCGEAGHISRDCANSKNVASATSRKQWPKNRRIDKDVTMLDRSNFHWTAVELAAANEITRLLEINVDASIQYTKIELLMLAKKPKVIERETWLRTTGERRKVTYQPPIDHAELIEQKKIFDEELHLSHEHFVVAQKEFFAAVYDSSRQAPWVVQQHQGDKPHVIDAIEKSRARFEATNVKDKKMMYAIDWLNVLFTEAKFRKTEGVKELRKNEAERLAKAAIHDAAARLAAGNGGGSDDDAAVPVISGEEQARINQEADRKRAREESIELALRSVNNTMFAARE